MSVSAKWFYRFVFLKCERWKNLRLARLAKDRGKCQICGKEDIHNDVHHIVYRDRFEDTKVEDLRTLCRRCHQEAHRIMEAQPGLKWSSIKTRINPPGRPKKLTGSDYARRHFLKIAVDSTMIVS